MKIKGITKLHGKTYISEYGEAATVTQLFGCGLYYQVFLSHWCFNYGILGR